MNFHILTCKLYNPRDLLLHTSSFYTEVMLCVFLFQKATLLTDYPFKFHMFLAGLPVPGQLGGRRRKNWHPPLLPCLEKIPSDLSYALKFVKGIHFSYDPGTFQTASLHYDLKQVSLCMDCSRVGYWFPTALQLFQMKALLVFRVRCCPGAGPLCWGAGCGASIAYSSGGTLQLWHPSQLLHCGDGFWLDLVSSPRTCPNVSFSLYP